MADNSQWNETITNVANQIDSEDFARVFLIQERAESLERKKQSWKSASGNNSIIIQLDIHLIFKEEQPFSKNLKIPHIKSLMHSHTLKLIAIISQLLLGFFLLFFNCIQFVVEVDCSFWRQFNTKRNVLCTFEKKIRRCSIIISNFFWCFFCIEQFFLLCWRSVIRCTKVTKPKEKESKMPTTR